MKTVNKKAILMDSDNYFGKTFINNIINFISNIRKIKIYKCNNDLNPNFYKKFKCYQTSDKSNRTVKYI